MRTLYYRGLFRSCNYNCTYCPFFASNKNHFKREYDETADSEATLKFFKFCKSDTFKAAGISEIMFTPYGEAMIYPDYHVTLMALCCNDSIKRVGCQTNLSFDVEGFISRLKGFKPSEEISKTYKKLRFWCTFHPQRVDVNDFLAKCNMLLDSGITFCVGAVGIPQNIEILQYLRNSLSKEVYFWINALSQKKYGYSAYEISAFSAIDPLFFFEINHIKADSNLCSAGRKSLFIEANGNAYACHNSKAPLGNIYKSGILPTGSSCKAKECNCFLSYIHRVDEMMKPLLDCLGDERTFRVIP